MKINTRIPLVCHNPDCGKDLSPKVKLVYLDEGVDGIFFSSPQPIAQVQGHLLQVTTVHVRRFCNLACQQRSYDIHIRDMIEESARELR